jgi:hypothetical protein
VIRAGYALGALILTICALVGVRFSGATWTHESDTGVQVQAAADWTPPDVAVVDPGYAVSGTVTISAIASDAISDLVSVEIQYAVAGSGDWQTLCVATEQPWSCVWDTTEDEDGPHDLRAIALDDEDNPRTSDVVTTEVLNTAGVVIDPVPSPLRGTVTLTGRLLNVGGLPSTITFQASLAGRDEWVDIGDLEGDCAQLQGLEGSCRFDTSQYGPFAATFDLRVVGVIGNQTYYDVQEDILVDNQPPAVTLSVPASPLSGTVDLTASASDVGAGVESVLFEHRPVNGTWTPCGPADTTGPDYRCSLDTTSLAEGDHEFRATVTDRAGNTTSSTVEPRVVDNEAPQVTLSVPASPLIGTVTLAASASDAGSGVVSVRFDYRQQGVTDWLPCGTDYGAPWTCDWDTADGSYEFRAVAVDGAGRSTASGVETRGSFALPLDLATLPVATRSTEVLSATWNGPSSASVTFQRSPNGTNPWTDLCVGVQANPTAQCSWNAGTLATGIQHVRATTTYGGTTYSETQTVWIDKVNPATPSLSVPAGPLNGTVTLSAQATDAHSGVAEVRFEYRREGTTSWTECGRAAVAPYTCALDTTTLADDDYQFRVTAVDHAGNSRTSSPLQTRAVDTAISSVSVSQPVAGATLSGSVTVAADAVSTKPITSVTLQYSSGSGGWTTICAPESVPYACAWDTTTVSHGATEVRAVLEQDNGYTVTSTPVPVLVDRFRGLHVATSAGVDPGEPGLGDTIVLTYSAEADPATLIPGWNGVATVPVTVNGRNVAGAPPTAGDWIALPGNLGRVSFGQNYVDDRRTVTFGNSTVTVDTVPVGGDQVTRVTVTLSGRTAGNANWLNDTGTTAGSRTWTPSRDVRDTSDRPCDTTAVTRGPSVNL